jgi:hypothetical protein
MEDFLAVGYVLRKWDGGFSSSGKCIEEVGGRIFHDSGLYLRTKPLKVSQQEQAACLPYPPQSSTLRKNVIFSQT